MNSKVRSKMTQMKSSLPDAGRHDPKQSDTQRYDYNACEDSMWPLKNKL
jgi:hypothetical protein